jgi:hypothetical protein
LECSALAHGSGVDALTGGQVAGDVLDVAGALAASAEHAHVATGTS